MAIGTSPDSEEDCPRWNDVDWASYVHEVSLFGRVVRYVDYGVGPPLLLVHGMGGSWESWLANIPSLGESHRVIAVDLPGFGGSDPLPAGAVFGGYADVLEALLDELGLPGVAVFGHSLGGLVALTLAARSPERVRCAVLVSGGGVELSRARLAGIRAAFWVMKQLLTLPGVSSWLGRSKVTRMLMWPAVHDWRKLPRELAWEMFPRSVSSGFLDALRLGATGLRTLELSAVTAPVLLAWGREDRILPLSVGRQLEASLPDARLVVFRDVGHCAMFEDPDRFNRLAIRFLALHDSGEDLVPERRSTLRSWLASTPMDTNDSGEEQGDATA
jgi:pimeloyl-ACP methyl ester carboxylesterase